MDFQTKIPVDSKILPGVTFTLRRLSFNRRTAFHLALANYSAKLRDIRRERKPLDAEYQAAAEKAKAATEPEVQKLVDAGTPRVEAEKKVPIGKIDFPDERFEQWAALMDAEQKLDRAEMTPALIRTCFVGIEGFSQDGRVPATADELLEDAPPELVEEIAKASDWVMGLPADQQGNLRWPGTSDKAEAGPETVTTAPSAEEISST